MMFLIAHSVVFVTMKQVLREYADDLVLMVKEETVLQGMDDKLAEIVRWCGMEVNVLKWELQGNHPQRKLW